jgi:hypothetical protein
MQFSPDHLSAAGQQTLPDSGEPCRALPDWNVPLTCSLVELKIVRQMNE